MRTVKFSLLIASLALFFVHCGNSKPTPDAWASMVKNKVVRIATNPFNVPFETSIGVNVEGFDVDLGEAIAKDLGYPTKWIQPTEFEKVFEYLKTGQVEMIISTVAITEERKKEFAFSDPYFVSSNTIARRLDNNEIKDLPSLAGKRVGVQTGRTGDRFMTSQKTAANVILTRYKTLDDALGALNRGEIDAVIGDKPIMTYSIAKNYSTNLLPTDVELTRNQFAVVVRLNEIKLLAKINETIARLKRSNELVAWDQKWMGKVLAETSKTIADIQKKRELEAAPKNLAVRFVKAPGSTVKLERLDGFSVTLTGPNGTFKSAPILTDDANATGKTTFPKPIPPGDYKLILERLNASAQVAIAKTTATSLTLTVTVSDNKLDMAIK